MPAPCTAMAQIPAIASVRATVAVSQPYRIDATELWHFYDGDPLELRREWPDGRSDVQLQQEAGAEQGGEGD